MVSKTRLTQLIRRLDAAGVVEALRASPEQHGYRDDRGRNWLHLVAGVNPADKRVSPGEAVTISRYLLDEAGFDIDAAAFTEGAWRATPLWYAVGRGRNLLLVEYLLASGSSPEHCLWAASFNEDIGILAALIAAGAPLDTVVEDETPFFGAVKYSKFKAARVLLEAGSDPDRVDGKGRTALHMMLAKNSEVRHFAMFVTHGARGDIPDGSGRTAAEILKRKRNPAFHGIADQLRSG